MNISEELKRRLEERKSNSTTKITTETKKQSSNSSTADILKNRLGQRKAITEFGFDTLSSDLSSLSTTIDKAYNGWQSQETMKNTLSSVQSMYDRLGKYQEFAKQYGGTDLSELRDAYKGVLDNWDDLSKKYKGYSNAKDYNKAIKSAEALDKKMRTADIGKLETEITDLEKIFNVAKDYDSKATDFSKQSLNMRNPSAIKPFTDTLNKLTADRDNYLKSVGYTSMDELEKALGEKKVFKTNAERMQNLIKLSSVGDINAENYDKDYNKYVKSGKSVSVDDIGTTTEVRAGRGRRKVGKTVNSLEKEVALAYERRQNGEKSSASDTWANDKGALYDKMTDKEFDDFFYYYAKDMEDGGNRTEEYMNAIADNLNSRRGEDISKSVGDSTWGEARFAITSGLNQWMQGYMGNFAGEEYTPTSPIQYASGMVRENVEEDYGKFARTMYDLGVTGANQLPSILVSTLMNYATGGAYAAGTMGAKVMSGISKGAGLATMYGSARGNAYTEMLNLGYDKDQATTYANLVGASEVGLQALIGGISKLGGTSGMVDDFVKGIDNAFARFAIKYPLAMASEATEEGLQEILNPLFQNIAAGYDTGAKVDWGEVAYSALLGGLMGGMFEGPGLAVESVAEHLGDKRIGQTIKSNERVGDLFDLADNPEIKSAYDTYTRWANKGITADNVSDAKLGRLYSNARLDAQETIESKTSTDEQKASAHKILDNLDIYTQSSIESRTGSAQNIDKKFLKTFTDEDIKLQIDSSLEMDEDSEAYKIASKLQEKMDKGKKVTTTELASLMEATDNAVKADEYKDISTQIVEKGGGEELAKIVARKLRGETLTSEESKMVLESAIVPEVIGENTNAENQTSEILEKAKSMDNKAEASIFLAQYDGKTDVEAYTNAFNLVATKTRDNFTLAEVLNHRSVLSKTQVNAIYNELRIKPDKMKRFEYQKLSERTANLKFYKGAINDSVIDYTNRSTDAKEYRANPTGKVNWNSLTEEQRKSIVFFKGLAKGIGLRLNLVVDGEAEGFNGKFQISNNTITVDIFAEHEVIDDEVTKRMMVDSLVPTMSHELTHWMEQKSPELYRQICDIVFPTLQRRDGLTESERIAKEIRSMLEDEYKGKPIPAEALSEALTDSDRIKDARSEIVARACEDMLSQSKVGKEMFNSLSKQEQKTLVEKIKDIIKDFLNWIDEALGFYKSTSYEAGILRDFQEEANKISALWDKMLTDSAEVNQALEKSNAFKTFADDIYNSLVKDKQYEGYVIKDTHYSTTDDSAKFILAKPDGTSIAGSVSWNPASNEDVVSKRVAQIIAEELSAKVDTTSIGSRDMSELSKAVDTNGKSLFQYRAMVKDEDIYRAMLLKHKDTIGITDNQITELFNTIDKAIDIISDNLEALDYAWEADIDARAFSPIKPNSDTLYKVSLDFSTLCRKRLLQQTIARTLQNALDKNLSTEESIAIRDELMKVQEEGRKIEIACALCYVESARMKSPKQINKFLNNREASIREFFANKSGGSIKEKIANAEMKARKALAKKYPDGLPGKNDTILDALTAPKSHMIKSDADYIRNEGKKAKASYKLTEHEQAELNAALKMSIDDFTSAKGLENLAKNHPDIFDAYTSFVRNATHSKGIENDTWWRAGDAESIGDALIANMNAENGLRSQSWSDFQVIHLLDYIAATIELSTKGAKRQSYTKVPDYVKLLGNTGDMINMSLIPESAFNGKLSYDSVEGMAYEIAKQLRDEYHETAGTICIGINNEQIKLLLEDTTIDMVIPYHHSSMSKAVRKLMHIPAWETYQNYQGEKKLSETEAKANAKKYGVKLNTDANYQKAPKFSEWFNLEEARQIAKMENDNPSNQEAFKKYGKMYGGYMAMQNAANKYLKLCAERGLSPKFSNEKADFTQDANYWKLLIDRKMVDNVTGEIIEQKAIKPIFNEKSVLEILNDELTRYPEVKADQEYAHRKVVEKFLSGDMKVDKSTMEAIKKPIDNVTKVNIFETARKTDVLKASRKNPNLTDEDLNDYMRTGKTLHTRNKKQRMLESGKKPILTSSVETKEFISDAIKGKAPGEIRAFKKVGERLSNAINEKRSSLYMINKYLELNADDLRESYKRHSSPKEKGDIPLTEEDFENIPELVDEFDDVLGINTYNNKTEVHLYKETEEGYIRILTVVSSERNSLQVTKLIGVSKEKFEAKYTKKIEGNIGSPKSLIEDSNQSTTARLTADVPSTESVSPSGKNVKENFSDTDSEGKTLTKAQVVSDLSKLPADELLREFSNLALDVRSGLEKPSRHSESKLVEDKTKFVQYGDYIIEHIDEYTPDRLWVASQGIVYADIDRKIFTREHFIDVVQPKIDEIKKSLGYQNDAPESYDAGMENVIRSFFTNELGFKDASPENSKDIDNDAKDPWDDILYSKRTTPSAYETMGETERIRKENEKLDADASKLKNIIGTEEVANRRFLGLANYIKKLSGSTMDSAKLANILKDTYTSMQKAKSFSWGFIAEQTQGIAEMVMSNDMGVSSEYFKRVMSEIRKDKISLSEEQRVRMEERFGNYGNFHKYVFGRANITKDGTPLETVWKSWAEKYPSLFDKNVSGAEQIDALVEAVDALKATSSIMGEYEHQEAIRHLSTEIYNQFWNIAADTSTSDNTQSVRAEHKALMTELRKDYEQRQKSLTSHPTGETVLKYENLLKKVKETKRKEIARAKEHGKEMLGKYKENAERKTKIQSITSNSLSLNEMLLKNSKDKHIPEILKGPVTSLLQAIDFSSKRLISGGEATQKDISLSKALGKVKDMMVKATNAHEELVELYGHGLDEDIERLVDNVDTIMRMVGDNEFIINKMSLEDLHTLDKMVKTIKHAVNKLNKFHTVNHAKGIANLSVESVSYLNSLGKAKVYDGLKGATKKLLDWNNALPYYVFKRFGSGGMKVYEALQDGWDKFAFNTKQILDYANEAYTSKEVNEWSEEVKTFKIVIPANEFELADPDYTPQYQEVQLTVPQIMSMYCLNKREQARGHLFQGGIRVADFKTKKGEVISQSEGVIFTEKDISTILNSLTDRQRAVADKLQEFMNTVSTDWGNEVSMARFGYKAFGEENYFPIQSDDNNLSVNDATEQANSLFRLLNMSFTKSTVEKANNRIVISDIFDVFAQHTSDMAKYNALALPVLDAFKWYNFTEKQDVAEGTFKTIGVKQAIENAFGKDGKSYFTTFLKDINGQKEVSRDTLGKGFFTKAKIAAVGANLRVVALQPTSYFRASAVIDNKYLTKALGHKPKISKAETYCGMALWKSMGYYDTNIQKGLESQIKHADTWKDKATEWSMKGAEMADKLTWGYLWNACELEIRDTRTDLKVGSKEFYEAIGKRLREVIYATQVVDSTMTRSQMMRSSDGYEKMITSFASEPTLSYNMLQDAFMQYKLDARQMGKKEARAKNAKRIGRILYAYTMTNAIAALVESAFDAFRDDDDEEMDMIEFTKLYLKNFALDMSIGNKIPIIKEVYSALQGFSSSRLDTQWAQYLYGALNFKKPSTKISYGIRLVSQVSGLPFYNLYRDTMALLNKLDLFTEEDLNEMFGDFED